MQRDTSSPRATRTSGLRAELLSVAATRIQGDRILTSKRLELVVRPGGQAGEKGVRIHQLRPIDLARGVPAEQAIDQIQRFIGSRPLVGYYLQFDVAVLERHVRPKLGIPPQSAHRGLDPVLRCQAEAAAARQQH